MNRYYDIFSNARPINTHPKTDDQEKREPEEEEEEKKGKEEEDDIFYTPIEYMSGEVGGTEDIDSDDEEKFFYPLEELD